MTTQLQFNQSLSNSRAALIIDDQELPSKLIQKILNKINPSMICIHVDNTKEGMEWLTNPAKRIPNPRISSSETPDNDQGSIVKIKAVFLDNQVFHIKGGPLIENEGLQFLREYRKHPQYDPSILIFSNSSDSNPEKFEGEGFTAILNKKPSLEKLKSYQQLSESEDCLENKDTLASQLETLTI